MSLTNAVKRDYNFIWAAKRVSKEQVPVLLNKIRDSLSFEVTDIYPLTNLIPNDDFLILADSLKNRGFEIMAWGRGNWEKGPRITSLNLESGSYSCRLDKLYYSDSVKRHYYRVTERVAFLKK